MMIIRSSGGASATGSAGPGRRVGRVSDIMIVTVTVVHVHSESPGPGPSDRPAAAGARWDSDCPPAGRHGCRHRDRDGAASEVTDSEVRGVRARVTPACDVTAAGGHRAKPSGPLVTGSMSL